MWFVKLLLPTLSLPVAVKPPLAVKLPTVIAFVVVAPAVVTTSKVDAGADSKAAREADTLENPLIEISPSINSMKPGSAGVSAPIPGAPIVSLTAFLSKYNSPEPAERFPIVDIFPLVPLIEAMEKAPSTPKLREP